MSRDAIFSSRSTSHSEKTHFSNVDIVVKNKSNVAYRCLYSNRQRYASSHVPVVKICCGLTRQRVRVITVVKIHNILTAVMMRTRC